MLPCLKKLGIKGTRNKAQKHNKLDDVYGDNTYRNGNTGDMYFLIILN